MNFARVCHCHKLLDLFLLLLEEEEEALLEVSHRRRAICKHRTEMIKHSFVLLQFFLGRFLVLIFCVIILRISVSDALDIPRRDA